MVINDKYSDYILAQVIEAYLVDGMSHRQIQREILNLPAPLRGGGYIVMKILHNFDLREDAKGAYKKLDTMESKSKGVIEAIEYVKELQNRRNEANAYYNQPQKINTFGESTERMGTIKLRVFQNKLREIILKNYNNTCALCEINKTDLLICSHIKPWNFDKDSRLYPTNAICLCVLHDKLFDRGYYSFDSSYSIIFSAKADKLIKDMMGGLKFKIPKFDSPDPQFLKFHSEEICFIK